MTTARANPYANFAMIQPLTDFANAAQHGLDPTIVELIKIRASQINGCAMCPHMHTRELLLGLEVRLQRLVSRIGYTQFRRCNPDKLRHLHRGALH